MSRKRKTKNDILLSNIEVIKTLLINLYTIQKQHSQNNISHISVKFFIFYYIYQAISKEAAEMEFNNFESKWGKKYPILIKSWKNKWEYLSEYFKYHEEIICISTPLIL